MVALSSIGESQLTPQAATPEHVAASVEALAQVAQAVSVHGLAAGTQPQYMRLCHYEHGYFLHPALFGFPVLGVTGEMVDVRQKPTLPRAVREAVAEEWRSNGLYDYLEPAEASEALVLRTPDATFENDPFTYAIVINHPVERQIQAALAALDGGLARRKVTAAALASGEISSLDLEIAVADEKSQANIADSIRRNGWQATAEHIRDRSIAESAPLVVTYDSPLFSREQLAQRVPALRRVYNEVPLVRGAVDKVAGLLSQGMTIVGDTSDRMLRSSLDMLDVGATRTYLAHLVRDAFVCGNGCLRFGRLPDSDIRLVVPEQLSLQAENRAVFPQSEDEHVLHVKGSDQLGSLYGASAIEPFIAHLAKRDTFISTLYMSRTWQLWKDVPSEHVEYAIQMEPFARRNIDEIERDIALILGDVTKDILAPPPNLYFIGRVRMEPTVSRFVSGGNR